MFKWSEFAGSYREAKVKKDFYKDAAGDLIRKKAGLESVSERMRDPLELRKKLDLLDFDKAKGHKLEWKTGDGYIANALASYAKECGSAKPEYDAMLMIESMVRLAPEFNPDSPGKSYHLKLDGGVMDLVVNGRTLLERAPILHEVLLTEGIEGERSELRSRTQEELQAVKDDVQEEGMEDPLNDPTDLLAEFLAESELTSIPQVEELEPVQEESPLLQFGLLMKLIGQVDESSQLDEAHEKERAKEAAIRKIGTILGASGGVSRAARNLNVPKAEFIQDWANVIYESMEAVGMEITDENLGICLTQLEREGAYYEEPPIPDTDALYQRYRAKLQRKLDENLSGLLSPLKGQVEGILASYEKEFKPKFLACKTERDIERLVAQVFRDIDNNPKVLALFETPVIGPKVKEAWLSTSEEWRNPVKTVGAMQISPKTARRVLEEQGIDFETEAELRDYLYTKEGNLRVGFALLKNASEAYLASGTGGVEYVFADYNAGPFASRNAAFQDVLSKLTPQDEPLALDGDLIAYDSEGNPRTTASNTEKRVRAIRDQYGLEITDEQIRADLVTEKTGILEGSLTYQYIQSTYIKKIQTQPPYAIMPRAEASGSEEKFGMTITTTGYVAGSVNLYRRVYERAKRA